MSSVEGKKRKEGSGQKNADGKRSGEKRAGQEPDGKSRGADKESTMKSSSAGGVKATNLLIKDRD